jgi:ribosome-binding protein aMBF1 (putative translation factor)
MTDLQIVNILRGLKLTDAEVAQGVPMAVEHFKDIKRGRSKIRRLENDALRKFFGKKFIEVRGAQGLSRDDLANIVNIPSSTVADWERFSQRQ